MPILQELSIPEAGVEKYIDTLNIASITGGELNEWNESYFFNNHFPKDKIEGVNNSTIKAACMKLASFYAGAISVYKDIHLDMIIAALSVRNPQAPEFLLFKDFLHSTTFATPSKSDTKIWEAPVAQKDGYLAVKQTIDASKGLGARDLAEDVESSEQPVDKIDNTTSYDSSSIGTFWNEIGTMLKTISDQGEVNEDGRIASNIIGFITLHCFKLMVKSSETVQRSIGNRINKQYGELFKNLPFTFVIVPPCIGSLKAMQNVFDGNVKLKNILSLMIGMAIVEHNRPSPSKEIIGILYGSCLTHVGMYGLAPAKHLEHAAKACGLTIKAFAKQICTSLVKDSLVDTLQLLGISGIACEVKIMETTYKLKGQISWRYCRLYNTAHFSRFSTVNNTRLIIRCAAYIDIFERNSAVKDMYVLQSEHAKQVFGVERGKADMFAKMSISEIDSPLTTESKKIYTERSRTLDMNESLFAS